jgi:hypothetical protein
MIVLHKKTNHPDQRQKPDRIRRLTGRLSSDFPIMPAERLAAGSVEANGRVFQLTLDAVRHGNVKPAISVRASFGSTGQLGDCG